MAERRPRTRKSDGFDANAGFVHFVLALVFANSGIASGYATFTGIRLFLNEAGDVSLMVNGTSVILTIAVSMILIVGWTLIVRWGPEAKTGFRKSLMVILGLMLFLITLCVSSLSNLMGLVGPSAKIDDWRGTLTAMTEVVDDMAQGSLGAIQLLPLWEAQNAQACALAHGEAEGGIATGLGSGVGPVAAALLTTCEQTGSVVISARGAIAAAQTGIEAARQALADMRAAIRTRSVPAIEREDLFLDAGDALNAAVQDIRRADLSATLEAGALFVQESVAELSQNSSFSPRQVEMVASLREGLNGLVASTEALTTNMRASADIDVPPVESPTYIQAIGRSLVTHLPVVAAAVALDCFQLWSLGFLLVMKGGRKRRRRRI